MIIKHIRLKHADDKTPFEGFYKEHDKFIEQCKNEGFDLKDKTKSHITTSLDNNYNDDTYDVNALAINADEIMEELSKGTCSLIIYTSNTALIGITAFNNLNKQGDRLWLAI